MQTLRLELQTINRQSCTITEKAPNILLVKNTYILATTAFTFKTLLKHYAKQVSQFNVLHLLWVNAHLA